MKEKIKDLWVRELKSGAWDKTERALCVSDEHGDSFCCLRVLTELYIRERNKKLKRKIGWERKDDGDMEFRKEDQFLMPQVKRWAGIKTFRGWFNSEDGRQQSLTSLNDRNKTFAPVIEAIEKHWKDL